MTRRFWRLMPLRSYLVFLTGVFCLFSTFGFLNDIDAAGRTSTRELVLDVLLCGLVAVAWVLVGTKGRKFLVLAVPLIIFSIGRTSLDEFAPAALDAAAIDAMERRLQVDAAATAIGVVLGYLCFIVFVATEGKRYLRVQAEMALARDLHQIIAPRIERRLERFEFFGASLPSSEVGGDLVDVVVPDSRWTAYVADVSGHGVVSGTLMAMFKSATRIQLMAKKDLEAVLADINEVIIDLKQSSMFITCAFLVCETDETLRFTLAGHLPILHYRQARRAIDELSIAHVPLGMFEHQSYRTMPVQFQRGDLFALVTDGLTEVFDARDNEFGMERLKSAIAANAEQPLPDLFDAVIAEARRHGRRSDDQSLLLVRCL